MASIKVAVSATASVNPSFTGGPMVTVTIGPPVKLGGIDAVIDTAALMGAIVDLLPDEARAVHVPTEEELAATRPSA